MQLILTVLHLVLAIGIITLVLLQHGKGADAGAAFGSGASSTVFGAQGSGSFLSRSTAILAILFFLTSIVLAYFAARVGEPEGLMDDLDRPIPVAPEQEGPRDGPPIPESAPESAPGPTPESAPGPASEEVPAVDDLPAPSENAEVPGDGASDLPPAATDSANREQDGTNPADSQSELPPVD
ncbi:MAG: preprotein translocase subunit SecG [Halochromatium sp.]|uniref:preprotein translocase subunit SecG n=1 Tax=Halochromatium sp. TaxID=2049430 RepID=UPI00397B0E9A